MHILIRLFDFVQTGSLGDDSVKASMILIFGALMGVLLGSYLYRRCIQFFNENFEEDLKVPIR